MSLCAPQPTEKRLILFHHPSVRGHGCTSTAAARGASRAVFSTSRISPMAGFIGLVRMTSRSAPLTPAPAAPGHQWRFADGIIDQKRQRWVGVREDHTAPGQPVNALVAVDLAQPGMAPGGIIAEGHDFFASPRLSPDGRRLAWLVWDHPNMPWNGTTLYVAELGDDGAIIGTPRVVAGGVANRSSNPNGPPMAANFVSSRTGQVGGTSFV